MLDANFKPTLELKKLGDIEVYTDENLFNLTGTRIAFTTRHGGVSVDDYGEFNLGKRVDDDPKSVAQNLDILKRSLNANIETYIINPKQVHGNKCINVTSLQEKAFLSATKEAEAGADAIVCTESNVLTYLCFADCTPIILVAPNGWYAVVHAGWRGVVSKVVEVALQNLCKATCIESCNIICYIGAHLRDCCFEAGEECKQEFLDIFGCSALSYNGNISMERCITQTLLDKGVQKANICSLGICTKCHNDEFFSYRAQNGKCGRHAAVAIHRHK